MDRRTKVVATLGPALDRDGALDELLAAGVDVLRVNLSHAPPLQQAERVRKARAIKPEIAILVDLAGPKLRLGELSTEVSLLAGQSVTLGVGGVPVGDATLFGRVHAGDPIYVADGTIQLEAVTVERDRLVCRVVTGGVLRSRKGINLPCDRSSLSGLTDRDRKDLMEIDAIAPDYIALSYVRHERDIEELRRIVRFPIVAKIEKQEAVDRLDAIVAAADGIMVARGDLGVEIPIEKVPAVQKRLIRAANAAGRPVITATQMLLSMVSSPLPTRAEVTDVANAVLDGTDAVMLSEETAIGRDPAGVVRMMVRLLRETEPLLRPHDAPPRSMTGNALAHAAVQLAEDLNAAAIVAPTRTGISAQRLAAFRPARPILAFSRVPETTRRLALVWGVEPIDLKVPAGADPVSATLVAARHKLGAGALVVLLDIAPAGVNGVPSLVNAITL